MQPRQAIELTGLRADVPIGFLAAMGTLRMLSAIGASSPVMAWKPRLGAFHPVILWDKSSESGNDPHQELISALIGFSGPGWPDQHAFQCAEQIKGMDAADFARLSDVLLDWYPAFGSELIANDKSEIESTPLDMSFAKQKFLADTLKLREELLHPKGKKAPKTEDYFSEALFGPWRYRDDCHSRGWDPATLKEAAFTHQEPSPMPNAGMRALVWLAIHGLPFFPCFVVRRRLLPRGFTSTPNEMRMHWPIWEPFLDIRSIEPLLGQVPRLLRVDNGKEELVARGVSAVYSSRRAKLTKYQVSLLTAERML